LIKIIGTGHVLKRSINEVKKEILELRPEFVAVELDKKRYEILKENNFELNFKQNFSIDYFLSPVNIVHYLLAMLQKEIGKNLNVFPGSEMVEAILCAKKVNAKLVLIDRDIDVTMNRILNLPLNEKIKMLTISSNRLKFQKIEDLLDEENLLKITLTMKKFPKFYKGLVEERDMYMAMNLFLLQSKFPNANIVAVVGAGHKEGVEKFLNEFKNEKDFQKFSGINKINKIEKPSLFSYTTNILFVFVILIIFIIMKSYNLKKIFIKNDH